MGDSEADVRRYGALDDPAEDRACKFLDAAASSDQARVVIMDLLDALSARKGEVERLSQKISALCDEIDDLEVRCGERIK